MTRRRAAWIAAVVAVLLGATYLMTRRRGAAPEIPAFSPPPAPPAPKPVTPVAPAVLTASTTEPEPEPATTAPLPVKKKPEPRSWGGSRAVPARTPPPVTEDAVTTSVDVEHPLPTWIRVGIVVAALAAFFAVSLIATKQV